MYSDTVKSKNTEMCKMSFIPALGFVGFELRGQQRLFEGKV